MVIMIWIQTGFAMVVISAAIKGVPAELNEAARVDGANETQLFWRVTLPQITGTILVVVTTLTITVLKIFDLVKATTGGAADTDVLANRVYEGLRNGNFTVSSVFAVMIFILVIPIGYLNIRRNREEVAR
jgi:alpha-glucoside transport system permease protein